MASRTEYRVKLDHPTSQDYRGEFKLTVVRHEDGTLNVRGDGFGYGPDQLAACPDKEAIRQFIQAFGCSFAYPSPIRKLPKRTTAN